MPLGSSLELQDPFPQVRDIVDISIINYFSYRHVVAIIDGYLFQQ